MAVKDAKMAKNEVRAAVRDDYVKSAEQLIKDSDGALQSTDSAIRFKEVKKLKPKKPRKIHFVAEKASERTPGTSKQSCSRATSELC